ncbi:RNA-directed DNA polymerase from mobile element jockey-like [Brachionus plicatilis]|uniref:RNA-directed DNA polymerase from mobile element jockey-like n=1 Tax=Brachionus plicatilis TaxID=10195 RepID=A0A3M7SIV9_BRAPC|nr:RNA-directed DNA polymerase from mobile element jockey-like [Brachionus plicatilis]
MDAKPSQKFRNKALVGNHPALVEKFGVCVGKGIVKWTESVTINFSNLTNHSVALPEGTVVGQLKQVKGKDYHLITLEEWTTPQVNADKKVLNYRKELISPTWSNTWRMLFNVSKCKAMEFSRSGKNIYAKSELLMGNDESRSALAFVDTEKDLGVTFSRNLKFSIHIKNQVNRATEILGQLKRSFRYWIKDHLDAGPSIVPTRKDARATKLVPFFFVPRIRNWRYEDILAILSLTPFMSAWAGCTPRFPQVHYPNPDPPVVSEVMQEDGQASTKCLQRANTFTNRIVNEWNALPATFTDADSVNKFKSGYDAFRSSQQS